MVGIKEYLGDEISRLPAFKGSPPIPATSLVSEPATSIDGLDTVSNDLFQTQPTPSKTNISNLGPTIPVPQQLTKIEINRAFAKPDATFTHNTVTIDITAAITEYLRAQAVAEEHGKISGTEFVSRNGPAPYSSNCMGTVYDIYNSYKIDYKKVYFVYYDIWGFLKQYCRKIRHPQPGDIITFRPQKRDNNPMFDHLGIYLGKNQRNEPIFFQQLNIDAPYKVTSLKELLGIDNYGKCVEFYESAIFDFCVSRSADFFYNHRQSTSAFWQQEESALKKKLF
ncbi:MAG: hypothetical protein JW841_00195 [Deltaproteobacteria bacterium]|nr:hypothetical protein [Deltaproteobacteria bacterium]